MGKVRNFEESVLTRESESDRSLVVFFGLFLVQAAPDLILADDLSIVIRVAVLNIGRFDEGSSEVVIAHPDLLLSGLGLGCFGVDALALLLLDWVAVLFPVALLPGHLLASGVGLGDIAGLLHRTALGLGQLRAGRGVVLPLLVPVGVGPPVLLAAPHVLVPALVFRVGLRDLPHQILADVVVVGLALLDPVALLLSVGRALLPLLLNLLDGVNGLPLQAAPVAQGTTPVYAGSPTTVAASAAPPARPGAVALREAVGAGGGGGGKDHAD